MTLLLRENPVTETRLAEFLRHLREIGAEDTTSAAARRAIRAGYDITASYISKLESGETIQPGPLKLLALAEAYRERWPGGRTSLFWELWVRAGYPLPIGLPVLLQQAANDEDRLGALMELIDTVGGWRTDEIRQATQDIRDRRDPEARRLRGPDVSPPITRLPVH